MTSLFIEDEAKDEAATDGGAGRMGLGGRRALVAVIGAVLALGSGAGVAAAFRLPPAPVADAVDPVVPDELPSQTAARAYALNNPPSYALAFKTPEPDTRSEQTRLAAQNPRTDISDAPDEDAASSQPTSSLAVASDDAKPSAAPAVAAAPEPAGQS